MRLAKVEKLGETKIIWYLEMALFEICKSREARRNCFDALRWHCTSLAKNIERSRKAVTFQRVTVQSPPFVRACVCVCVCVFVCVCMCVCISAISNSLSLTLYSYIEISGHKRKRNEADFIFIHQRSCLSLFYNIWMFFRIRVVFHFVIHSGFLSSYRHSCCSASGRSFEPVYIPS